MTMCHGRNCVASRGLQYFASDVVNAREIEKDRFVMKIWGICGQIFCFLNRIESESNRVPAESNRVDFESNLLGDLNRD